MAEPAPTTDTSVVPGAGDMHSLESRLPPEALQELDKMNDTFGGPQFGQPDAIVPAKTGQDAAETEVVPAKTGQAAPPSKEPALTTFDEFTPPDDLTPAATEKPADKPAEIKLDYKAGAEIMPDAEIDKLRTDRQKTNIKDLRSAYERALGELKADKARIEEFSKAAPDARVVELEQRNAQLNAIVERKALEEHPWVQQNFDKPRANALEYGHKALDMAKLDPKSLDRIFGMSGEERVSALDALYESIESPTLRAKVEKAVTVIEANDDQKAAFFADREANFARMDQEQKALQQRQVIEQEKNLGTAIDQIVPFLAKDKGFSFLASSDKPGSEKWNEALNSDIAQAKEFLLKNTDPQKLIMMAVLAHRAPRMQIGYNALRKKLAAFEGKQAESRNGSPRINGDGSPTRSSGSANDPNEGLVAAGRRVLSEVTRGE